jgi:polyhydroxybutyrate depolymerase
VIGELRTRCMALLAFGITALQCSHADLYPITEGGDDQGDAASVDAADGPNQDAASVLCPQMARMAVDSAQSVVVDGVSRSFILHVPAAYQGENPAPLILDFHGLGESAAKELASSPYPGFLDPEGVVMAFPDGLKGPAGTAWNVGPCCVANVDDVAFARAVVARVERLACIDTQRVYAVGVLTGGGMAHYVACHAADVFAAVAPAAFDLLQENQGDCVPSRPITVLAFRGTADSRVAYEGGLSPLVPGLPVTFLGARASFERWAAIDSCTGSPSAPDANGCSTYTACAGDAEVVLCTKQGGREEPGDPKIAWPVLKRHPL